MADNLDPDRDLDIDVESDTNREATAAEQAQRKKNAPILKLARKRFRKGLEAWGPQRKDAQDAEEFTVGRWNGKTLQWPSTYESERTTDGRPCFTINRMPTFIRLVVNQALGANLRVIVTPGPRGTQPRAVKIAEVIQGLLRNIETDSMHHWVYGTAGQKQAEQGLGVFKIVTVWEDPNDPDNWNQKVLIKRVRNPRTVVYDPAFEEMDASDADWAFEVRAVDADIYELETGKKLPPQDRIKDVFALDDAEFGDWFPNGKTIFAWYYSREPIPGQKKTVVRLDTGQTFDAGSDELQAALDAGAKETGRRLVVPTQMVKRKITAMDVLEETVWPGKAVPMIPVIGREIEFKGERSFRGVVYDAMEPAEIYNVAVTNAAEQAALGTKASVVGWKGQFGKEGSDMRKAWENAHKKPHPFLEVNFEDEDANKFPGAPWDVQYQPPIDGAMMVVHQADNDLKTVAGFHEASLAEEGPQESGKAINARQKQDLLQTSDYLDNLRWAMVAGARQIVKVMSEIYDTPRIMQITGLSGNPKSVMVFSGTHNDPRNDAFLDDDPQNPGQKTPFALPAGVDGPYDISEVDVSIEVNAGPDPGTQADKELDMISGLIGKLPPDYLTNFLDLAFRALKSTVGLEMADRAKKLMPRQDLVTDDDGHPVHPGPTPQQYQQLQQQMQMVVGALKHAQFLLQTKTAELGNKRYIAEITAYYNLLEALVKEESTDRRLVLEKQIERATTLLNAHQDHLESAQAQEMAALQPPQPGQPTPQGGPAGPAAPAAPAPVDTTTGAAG